MERACPTLRRLLVAGAVLPSLVLVAPAGAAVRNADPNSAVTTGDCAVVACQVNYAVSGAASGDTIVLAPGTYPVASSITASVPVHVTGASRTDRAVLVGDAALAAPTLALPKGGTVTSVSIEVHAIDGTGLRMDGGTADDVFAIVKPNGLRADAIQLQGRALLRNSVAWTQRGTTDAVETQDGTSGGAPSVVGVTAIAATDGTAYYARGTQRAQIRNSILKGTYAIGIHDGSGTSGPDAAGPRVSYTMVVGQMESGVQTSGTARSSSPPAFVDAAAGNFRSLAGSPVIDAGVSDVFSGGVDADGLMRSFGGAPDLGAYEFGSKPPSESSRPGGGSNGAGNGPPPTTPHPPATEPVMGSTVTLDGVRGNPRVRLPGTKEWVELTADSTVPVGAIVDATHGMVALTSVRDRSGRTQTGKFWGGMFQVKQSRRDGVTELILKGAMPICKRRGQVSASRKKKRGGRRLWGSDRGGRFRTRGRHGSATVRGTKWLTEERCKGTYFKVTQGAIDVRAKGRKKPIRLKRGQSRLIKPRR